MSNYSNKYIWAAVVSENDDPLMLNRVRVSFNTSPIDGDNNTSILKSVPDTYDGKPTKNGDDLLPEFKWSKIDPFCFLPLLPIFLKVTPKNGEYVNIMWPNPESKFNEQYYIPGTFSSPLTMFKEDGQASRMFATRDRIVDSKLLKNKDNLKYWYPDTSGVFPEPDDVALIGRGTCDIIVKNDHVLLRAGRSTTKPDNPNKQMSVKSTRSFVQLSDFDIRITDLGTTETNRLEQDVAFVKTLIEWNILNPENQSDNFSIEIFLYRLPQKPEYTTKNLSVDSPVSTVDKSLVSFVSFNMVSSAQTIDHINTFIQQVNDGKINIPPFPITDVSNQFPIYFRPSSATYKWVKETTNTGNAEYINVSAIKGKVKFKSEKNGFGLIFFQNKEGQQATVRKEKLKEYDFENKSTTYNILGGDNILMLSHESKIPSKGKIILDNTTVSGISQDYIIKNIIPNTDASVRGDELIKFMNLVVRFLVAHVHPFPGLPPVPQSIDGVFAQDILTQLQNASSTILNQNIRIN